MRTLLAEVAPYLAFARAAFARQWTYGTANWAGLFTNSFFLFFRAYALEACFDARNEIGGLDAQAVVTYVTVSQSLVMVCPQWGALGLAAAVKSGQVAIQLLRPVDLYGSVLARRLALSAYYVGARMLPVLCIGGMAGLLSWPDPTWLPAFVISVVLGAIIGTSILVLAEASAFWFESERGVRYLILGAAVLPSGLLVPVDFFGPWLEVVATVLPFAHSLYTPTRIWMGGLTGAEVGGLLALQGGWAVALVWLARRVLAAGASRLQVLGG
ncbi:MAG: ABC-2 family transporter protein [Myxococcota bacterium]